ncbi:unnamed protein product, partial [marine sediment metagenome]
ANNFEKDEFGYIVYKTFSENYQPPKHWEIEAGKTITKFCDKNIYADCSYGINFATLGWIEENSDGRTVWRCRIRWEWLADVTVPANADGKARCQVLELVERQLAAKIRRIKEAAR